MYVAEDRVTESKILTPVGKVTESNGGDGAAVWAENSKPDGAATRSLELYDYTG